MHGRSPIDDAGQGTQQKSECTNSPHVLWDVVEVTPTWNTIDISSSCSPRLHCPLDRPERQWERVGSAERIRAWLDEARIHEPQLAAVIANS